jgi:hypothetical protein
MPYFLGTAKIKVGNKVQRKRFVIRSFFSNNLAPQTEAMTRLKSHLRMAYKKDSIESCNIEELEFTSEGVLPIKNN